MVQSVSFEQRIAGVLVPLFALRGRVDHGCGDTGALREFIVWAAAHGFRCVQLLPVNETGADHSPYNAISSVAIEPATVDLTALADLTAEELAALAAEHRVAELAAGPVRWAEVKAFKRAALRRAYANFKRRSKDDGAALAYEEFEGREANWLTMYSLFRALVQSQGSEKWDAWAEPLRTVEGTIKWLIGLGADGDEFVEEIEFAKYAQWIAFTQWRAVRAFAAEHGVVLMGDVPFGVNYYSADVWAQRELFDLRWSGGAPPEPAFAGDEFVRRWGQNWGVPLYHWPAHRTTGFAWWRQRARKIEEAFHLFRIDHVLGFYRIYGFPWRPERNGEFTPLDAEQARSRAGGELPRFHEHGDDTPEDKAANRAQGEEFLRVLQNEAGPGALVGEDLGTVPDYVRPSLLSLSIPGFKVPQWEEEGGALVPGENYARCSVATFATHDHDPLAAMWAGWMGMIEAALAEPERLAFGRDAAWREVRRLAAWAGFDVPRIMPFEEVHERLVAGLLRSESWLAVLMITDLLGTAQRFNVPGSVGSANWSARLPAGWTELFADKCARIAALVREAGR